MAIIYTYPLLTSIQGDDLFLVSDTSNNNATRSITAADFGAYIQATYGPGANIYQADGSITGNRQLSGASLYSLTLASLTSFNVQSPSLFTSTVQLDSTITIPTGASNGYVLTSDGAGVATWQAIPGSTILTVNGTANRISVTDSSGPNPVVDIDSAYVGQTSITTLGTITTGTWNGTTIDIANGGTGATTAQGGINELTQSGGATTGHVLTRDVSGNAIWSAIPTGLTLTTTGTSGASTLIGNTLNIPIYADTNTNIYTTNGVIASGRTVELAGNVTWQGSGSSEVYYTNMNALGITDGSSISIDNGTIFQLDSTTRGFLPPRMTSTQMEAIGSPSEGLIVHATDADRPYFNNGTSWRGFGDLFGLYAQTVQSATITGTTETSVIGTGVGQLSIPANAFRVGDSFHGKIGGVISDTANGDSIIVRIKTGGTVLATTGAFALDTTAATGEGWEMELDFTIATLGATGSICTNGNFAYTKTNDKKVSGYVFQDVQPIDTTVSNTLDITVEWAQTGTNIYSANFVLYRTFVGS